ncbi:MAG: hypothetical protein EBT09_13440 [Actinobacteria bacterium]|nr:hypothetical protein [Actinomycetota bacterium]
MKPDGKSRQFEALRRSLAAAINLEPDLPASPDQPHPFVYFITIHNEPAPSREGNQNHQAIPQTR